MGSHFLLQGIFPTQELNPGLLHCRPILYCLSHQGIPGMGRGEKRGGWDGKWWITQNSWVWGVGTVTSKPLWGGDISVEAKGMGRCQLCRESGRWNVQRPWGCIAFTCAIPSKETSVVDQREREGGEKRGAEKDLRDGWSQTWGLWRSWWGIETAPSVVHGRHWRVWTEVP